jgi:hypothetical protein
MTELCRWVVDVARKNLVSLSGGPPAPTLLDMPQDVFINICEWLSVRDILSLRMVRIFLFLFRMSLRGMPLRQTSLLYQARIFLTFGYFSFESSWFHYPFFPLPLATVLERYYRRHMNGS